MIPLTLVSTEHAHGSALLPMHAMCTVARQNIAALAPSFERRPHWSKSSPQFPYREILRCGDGVRHLSYAGRMPVNQCPYVAAREQTSSKPCSAMNREGER